MSKEMTPEEIENIIPRSPFRDSEPLPLSVESFEWAMKVKKSNQASVQPEKTIARLCEIIEWQRQWIENIEPTGESK